MPIKAARGHDPFQVDGLCQRGNLHKVPLNRADSRCVLLSSATGCSLVKLSDPTQLFYFCRTVSSVWTSEFADRLGGKFSQRVLSPDNPPRRIELRFAVSPIESTRLTSDKFAGFGGSEVSQASVGKTIHFKERLVRMVEEFHEDKTVLELFGPMGSDWRL